MRSLTEFTKKVGKLLNNDENIVEGISITEFNKMMKKVRDQGVNLNRISATNLMMYLYNTMPKQDFKYLASKVEEIDKKDMKQMKTPTACGYDDEPDYGCGAPRRRRTSRSYGCGSDDDGRYC